MKPTLLPAQYIPRGVGVALAFGWIAVVAKCLALPMLLARWNVPVHPGWIIAPTLILAALATVVSLTHNWSDDSDGSDAFFIGPPRSR